MCDLILTLTLSKEKHTVDRELIIKHSRFLKDLLEAYPDKKEYDIPFPIKSLYRFLDYIKGGEYSYTLDYDEFLVHKFLDTKSYFDHLIYLMVEEDPDHKKIKSLDDDLSWEIYDHLPLNLIPEEMLTDTFIERYKTKHLPKYPEKVRITRSERGVKTEVLISGTYSNVGLVMFWYKNGQVMEKCIWLNGLKCGLYQQWYESGQIMERSNWLYGTKHGLYESWYKNGQLMEQSTWCEGREHGLMQRWYESGDLMERSEWLQGTYEGFIEAW